MVSQGDGRHAFVSEADERFFRIFVPYEIRLAQRRAMEWGDGRGEPPPTNFFGLFLVRYGIGEETGPSRRPEVDGQVLRLLQTALRDSDVAGRLASGELLAVVRDLDPMQAYVVAQRFLAAASRSPELREADVRTRVGYVIYPLSSQANFPAERWETLLDLARKVSERAAGGPATGYGVLRGPDAAAAALPETDLVPLAFEDPDSLMKAGLLSLQRIHLLPGG